MKEFITIIGAGSLGSATAVILSKMGCRRIIVYDFDTIEPHNVPNQMCLSSPGVNKARALEKLVGMLGGQIIPIGKRWKPGQSLQGIVIPAVDSIDIRREIWNWIKDSNDGQVTFVVDPRMGGEIGSIYIADFSDPKSIEYYEKEALFSAQDRTELECTARAIMYCPIVVAGLVASIIKEIATTGHTTAKAIHLDLKNRTLIT